MPRKGSNRDVRWFAEDPCYVFHTLNAYDDGSSVVLDACRNREVWRKAGDMQTASGKLTLHRFRFDLRSGAMKEETLDDRPMEFPRVADAVAAAGTASASRCASCRASPRVWASWAS
jgi:carotenoid cleavage dioxygenase